MCDMPHVGVAPAHQGDLLVLGEPLRVGLLDEDFGTVPDCFGADVRVFAVLGLLLRVGRDAGALDGGRDRGGFGNRRVARGDGVDDFFVGGPEDGPVEVDDVAGGALLEDELAEGGDGHTVPADAADGGEAGVVPAADDALVDEFGEFAFREQGADEVHAGKVPDVDFAEVERGEHPVVLRVAVAVFVCAEGVGDAFP